jgi:hypothetical protein
MLGAQLDSVVEAYHTGFARAIQNYSAILALFTESKEQARHRHPPRLAQHTGAAHGSVQMC